MPKRIARTIRPRWTPRFVARLLTGLACLAFGLFALWPGLVVTSVVFFGLALLATWPVLRDAGLLRRGVAVPAVVVEKDFGSVRRRIAYELRESEDTGTAPIRVRLTVSSATFRNTNLGDRLTAYHSLWEPRVCTADRFACFRTVRS